MLKRNGISQLENVSIMNCIYLDFNAKATILTDILYLFRTIKNYILYNVFTRDELKEIIDYKKKTTPLPSDEWMTFFESI